MEKITTGKVVKYIATPGIVPRLKHLFGSGFGFTAFFMAQIYSIVRLIPANHPYLLPQNMGKFGFRHVIAEAANNIVFSRKNIDQILIFCTMLIGFIILCVQIALLAYTLVIAPAFAGFGNVTEPPPYIDMFTTPNPQNDIALNMLDRVFGIPNIFCTKVNDTTTNCTKFHAQYAETGFFPFHRALHGMLKFYSYGMLFIAGLIFVYFIIIIVGETAMSGTPFGERFQNVWVPIRIIMAIGLLLPLNHGLNGGQYIALQAAKMGSGFATNGWNSFTGSTAAQADLAKNQNVDSTDIQPLGNGHLLALPAAPPIDATIKFMALVHACAYTTWAHAYPHNEKMTERDPWGSEGGVLDPQIEGGLGTTSSGQYVKDPYKYIRPYIQKGPAAEDGYRDIAAGDGTTYIEALAHAENKDIIITFGVLEGELEDKKLENTCGQISIPISDNKNKGCGVIEFSTSTPTFSSDLSLSKDCEDGEIGGPDRMQHFYYHMIKDLWPNEYGAMNVAQQTGDTEGTTGVSNQLGPMLFSFVHRYMSIITAKDLKDKDGNQITPFMCLIGCHYDEKNKGSTDSTVMTLPSCDETKVNDVTSKPCETEHPDPDELDDLIKEYIILTRAEIRSAWSKYNTYLSTTDQYTHDTDRNLGWGGAGLWYNKLQQENATFIDASTKVPKSISYPLIMARVYKEKKAINPGITMENRYDPVITDPNSENDPPELLKDYKYKHGGDKTTIASELSTFFKYYDIEGRDSTQGHNSGIVFKEVINRVLGISGLEDMRGEGNAVHPLVKLIALGKGLVNSAIINVIAGFVGSAVPNDLISRVGQSLSGLAFISLTAGILLFYVLPFLPFIYFFFAVGGWVKGLFEAMVGIPLWALAHLRIDGEGLAGQSASGGYLLIFDIFLRPITIVFGMAAAMIIFVAQVRLLDFIWDIVLVNLGGYSGDMDFQIETDTFDYEIDRKDADGNVVKDENGNALKDTVHVLEDLNVKDFTISTGPIDHFFFTIIYTFVVYTIATASFKLIDEIPKQLNRWMGGGVATFGDQRQDATAGLQQYVAIGGMQIGQKIAGAGQGVGQGLGQVIKSSQPDPKTDKAG